MVELERPEFKEILKIKQQILKHPKMNVIAYMIYNISLDNELYPIEIFSIQEHFKSIVQDVRNELSEKLWNNPQ